MEVEAKIKDILNFQSDRIILGALEAPLPNETGINNKAMAKKDLVKYHTHDQTIRLKYQR